MSAADRLDQALDAIDTGLDQLEHASRPPGRPAPATEEPAEEPLDTGLKPGDTCAAGTAHRHWWAGITDRLDEADQ